MAWLRSARAAGPPPDLVSWRPSTITDDRPMRLKLGAKRRAGEVLEPDRCERQKRRHQAYFGSGPRRL